VGAREETGVTKRRKWRFEGFDGTARFFGTDVPIHHLSEGQVQEALRRLVSRHLSDSEIIEASLNRKGNPTSLLEVRRELQPSLTMTCGSNPHYAARVIEV
jgi:hypothetical protein